MCVCVRVCVFVCMHVCVCVGRGGGGEHMYACMTPSFFNYGKLQASNVKPRSTLISITNALEHYYSCRLLETSFVSCLWLGWDI